ncbi:DNA repair protein RecO [Nitrosococcus watsonii]|uniref:DNA repair protein RecO n=1 Tax=Nitrosococcus watsoni (strain C-113) TaxID=105559 RepID=D8K8M4_NITWC|nr:DNA repair protein RecO [Nitrosococcus watsonii]ADJ29144.1 DNA repair protein RecO [Nitrosococcus watsonii C-113]
MKVLLQPAYILHSRPYRETSVLVEAFTPEYGRVGLVAKGVKRRRSHGVSPLQPFCPLLLSWTGRGDLVTLTGAEATGPAFTLTGEGLICAFYLNELLLRLLPRRDPLEDLFSAYAHSLPSLRHARQRQQTLRLFERDLLACLGYGLILDHEVNSSRPIEAEQWYSYQLEKGPVRLPSNGLEGMKISGHTLQALAQGALADPVSLGEAKRLLRWLLAVHLGDKPLKSRGLLEELRRLGNVNRVEKKSAHDCKSRYFTGS